MWNTNSAWVQRSRCFVCATLLCIAPLNVNATLIVDAPLPITHEVEVQIIQTARDDGSLPATVFGNATQWADIEASVDSIWAQAGIDVEFLPNVVRYDNTFALQGNAGGGTRPSGDLSTIISNASTAGISNPTPSVINMFFVEIVPAFSFTTENTANGYARIGNDGITQFVGENLLSFQNGRDVVASVVAHEIGHNLGLKHTASGGANLMSPSGTTEQLTQQQIDAIFQTTFRNDSLAYIPSGGTGFPQPLSIVEYASDFNDDDQVDNIDLQWWESAFGANANGDADDDNDTDGIDFLIWQQEFGSGVAPTALAVTLPEPSSASLVGFVILWLRIRRMSEGNRTLV